MSAENGEFKKDEMKNLISRNVSVTIPAEMFYLLTRVFLPPLILAHVTLEEYGIWACCFILISYMGMGVFGISNVYVRYVADFHARGRLEKISGLLSTGVAVALVVSVVMLTALWFALPAVIGLFGISDALRRTAFILIFGTSVTFFFDLSFGAFAYVLNGLQRFTQQNVVWVVSYCVEAALIVALLLNGFGVYSLLWAFCARYAISTAAYVALCFRALPGLSVRPRNFDRSMLKLFYQYGLIVQISGLLGTVLRSVEKVLAGVFLGVRATGLFEVGEKLPVMATSIPSAITSVILPAMSHMHSLGRREDVAKLYLKGSRYLSMLTGLVMGFLAAFAAPIMRGWIGADPRLAVAAVILAFFALPFHMNVLTGPASVYYRGLGKPSRELVYPLVEICLIAAAVTSGFLVMGRSISTINVTVASSMVLSALIYLAWTNRNIGVPQATFLWQALVPGLAPYLLGWIAARAAAPIFAWDSMGRLSILAGLAVCAAVYALVTAFVQYRLLCDWGEREYLRRQALHTVGGLFARKRDS